MKTFFFVAYFIIYTSSVQAVREMRYKFSKAPYGSFAPIWDLKIYTWYYDNATGGHRHLHFHLIFPISD